MEPVNRDNRDDVVEIDLVELFGALLGRLWIIIISGAAAAVLTFLVSYFLITPKYESVTKMYIINRSNTDAVTYADLQAGSSLTKDYQELVTCRPVLEEVIAKANLDMDIEDLKKKIEVETPTDTRIVSVTVEDKDPYVARNIADLLRKSASKHITAVMDTEAVNVVEEASLPTEKSSPNILMNTVIGYVLGAILAIIVVIIIYISDDSIKNPDDVEKYLGLSVLGSIPFSDNDKEKKKKHKKNKQKEEKKAK